jgi:hypothetical protein
MQRGSEAKISARARLLCFVSPTLGLVRSIIHIVVTRRPRFPADRKLNVVLIARG